MRRNGGSWRRFRSIRQDRPKIESTRAGMPNLFFDLG